MPAMLKIAIINVCMLIVLVPIIEFLMSFKIRYIGFISAVHPMLPSADFWYRIGVNKNINCKTIGIS